MLLSADSAAWIAVFGCIVATVHCALHFATRNPRLFASLTFFALNWAVLLPYYGLQQKDLNPNPNMIEVADLLPLYSGLLLTLAGGPLRREADIRLQNNVAPTIRKFDKWTLSALYLILFFHVPFVPGINLPLGLIHHYLVILLGTAFTFLGFWSILEGLYRITSKKTRWWLLLFVIVLCVIAEISFTLHQVPNPNERMTDPFKWVFAGLKLLLCGAFLYAVVDISDEGTNEAN